MEGEMSKPIHICPDSSSTEPDNPEPQPMSSNRHGVSSGSSSSSKHRSVICAWISMIRELKN